MSQSPPEGRAFSRVGVQLAIALDAPGADPVTGRIRNLSASGVFIEFEPGSAPQLTAGARCRLLLTLGEPGEAAIHAQADVVRVEPGGAALRITEVDGAESFVHLRNLVLYNAADADTALAEFEAHVGLKTWE
jgi:hypothetical protein